MKRFSFIALACILLASTASAQVKFGGKAGINLANVSGKSEGESLNYDSKIGLHIGGVAEIPVSTNFSVMPELNFDQLGAKDKIDIPGVGSFETTINASYLSLPILAKYNIGGLGIYAGPQIGLLMSAKVKTDDEESDIKDDLKSTDFAAVFGAEYNFAYGIFVSARYNLGLTSIYDGSDPDTEIKNRAFTIGVGIKFGGSSSTAK